MKCYIDLHIHSCLSPCAEEDMTPNNIVNMSILKGLDIIAITDHNSAKNAAALVEAGRRQGLIVVPGIELSTLEEIHLLCLFKNLKDVHAFQSIVYENLPPLKNREDIFGSQIIMDSLDNEIGREEKFLSAATNLDVESSVNVVRTLGGIVIPSHVDRKSFSMLNTLGAIPEEYSFSYLEYTINCDLEAIFKEQPKLKKYSFLKSSDAHFLSSILEPVISIELPEKSIDALFDVLNNNKGGQILHI
ncbi:MAG: PHP domain-containing protein [Clostridiaceae bacterium]|nr:PHP domain-containing protein [Clostridiaceae bacterium]